MRRLSLFVSFVTLVGLSACGSSSGGGTGGNGGGAGTTGSGGSAGSDAVCGDTAATGSGQSCNSVTTTGPCVTGTLSTAAPPSPAGGTFSAGTYNLTSVTDYVAADAAVQMVQPARQTFVLSNVTATSLTLDQAVSSGTFFARSSGTMAISGLSATYTATCPVTDGGNQGEPAQFTVTSSGFTVLEPLGNGDIRLAVYSKAN